MVLLLIDMLGVKARWKQGRAHVEQAFELFDEFVLGGLGDAGTAPVDGGIDSDSAALVFEEPVHALEAARRIYLRAFADRDDGERYWVRGVLVPYGGQGLRETVSIPAPFDHLTRARHSEPLLDAIAVEQSGQIKGMRLVMSDALIDAAVREAVKLTVPGQAPLHPCKRLDFSGYPDPVDGVGWQDFLWMATVDEKDWVRRVRSIRTKMRHSWKSPEESAHAAATRVVFDQWRAILGNVGLYWGS